MIKNLVSIVVPTYNDAPYLNDAIDDLLNQTYQEIEIIIVNDGSTDNTSEILQKLELKNNKIKVINKKNGGTGSAINAGFAIAQGEFGTWVSSDDRKQYDLIEKLVNILKQNRDIEYVVSAYYSQYLNSIFRSFKPSLTKKGYKINDILLDKETSGKYFLVDEWVDINYGSCHSGVNYMFTMRLKNKCGNFLEIPGEDYYMSVLMGLNSRVAYLDHVLGQHNNPIDSLSVTNRACVTEANKKTRELIEQKNKIWYLKNIPKIAHFFYDSVDDEKFKNLLLFKEANPNWSINLYITEKNDLLKKANDEIAVKIILLDKIDQEIKNKKLFLKGGLLINNFITKCVSSIEANNNKNLDLNFFTDNVYNIVACCPNNQDILNFKG